MERVFKPPIASCFGKLDILKGKADWCRSMPHRSRRHPVEKPSAHGAIAVLSDIHSNLPALRAVLAECERRDVTQFVCLGDIVGYGPYPSECLRLIRELGCPVVIGNHDYYAAVQPVCSDMNALAVAGIEYSIEHLSADDRKWLASLPPVHVGHDTTFVHASMDEPLEWNYVMGPRDAEESMAFQKTCVGFCGHTHRPGIFSKPGSPEPVSIARSRMRLAATGKYLVNPGSVGQPRSGDPRAQFAVYEPQTQTVEFVKTKYDIESVVDAVIAAGLPTLVGERLRIGM